MSAWDFEEPSAVFAIIPRFRSSRLPHCTLLRQICQNLSLVDPRLTHAAPEQETAPVPPVWSEVEESPRQETNAALVLAFATEEVCTVGGVPLVHLAVRGCRCTGSWSRRRRRCRDRRGKSCPGETRPRRRQRSGCQIGSDVSLPPKRCRVVSLGFSRVIRIRRVVPGSR
jgi:hypothetical protein